MDPISFAINKHKESHDRRLGRAIAEAKKASDTSKTKMEPLVSIQNLDIIFLMLNEKEMFSSSIKVITEKIMTKGKII